MYGKPYSYCLRGKETNSDLVRNCNGSCATEIFVRLYVVSLFIVVLVDVVFSWIIMGHENLKYTESCLKKSPKSFEVHGNANSLAN